MLPPLANRAWPSVPQFDEKGSINSAVRNCRFTAPRETLYMTLTVNQHFRHLFSDASTGSWGLSLSKPTRLSTGTREMAWFPALAGGLYSRYPLS